MSNNYFSLLIILLICFSFFKVNAQNQSELPATSQIQAVEFRGLKKTKIEYLNRFLEVRMGMVYDSLMVRKDEQELQNLQYFSHVKCEVKDTIGGKKVIFDFREKFTLLPITSLNFSKDNLQLSLGANDFNFLGKGMYLKGIYHYYDRHSFEAAFFNPYLIGDKIGGGVEVGKFGTVEPTYFDEGKSFYNFTLWKLGVRTQYEISLRQRVGIGANYLRELYVKNEMRTEPGAPGIADKSFHKSLLQFFHQINHIKYQDYYQEGFRNYFYTDWVLTAGESDVFYKIVNELTYFKRIGKKRKGNWCNRMRFGLAQNKYSPFPPFVLDNYVNLRGIGNRVIRGTAELNISTEYRQTLFAKRWFAIQGVAFADYATIRLPEENLQSLFQNLEGDHWGLFSGLGLRLHLLDFFAATVRVDYSIDVRNRKLGQLVIGIGQYF